MKQKQMFFWISLAFSMIQQMLAIWSLVSQPFLNQIYGHRFFSYCACVCAQSCPTLCDPMDCSLPGSSVHGISQVRTLAWIAITSSMETPPPRNQTHISCISCTGRWMRFLLFFPPLCHLGSPYLFIIISISTASLLISSHFSYL